MGKDVGGWTGTECWGVGRLTSEHDIYNQSIKTAIRFLVRQSQKHIKVMKEPTTSQEKIKFIPGLAWCATGQLGCSGRWRFGATQLDLLI